MNKFSVISETRLMTCHPDIQRVMRRTLEIIDIAVIIGHRNEKDQNEAFANGASDKKWPNGKHNKLPSAAIDIAPTPVSFKDTRANIARYYYLAGIVKAVAFELGIKIRWGGDWDGDFDFSDQKLNDLVHYELAD